jgi:hypothetical protein
MSITYYRAFAFHAKMSYVVILYDNRTALIKNKNIFSILIIEFYMHSKAIDILMNCFFRNCNV